MKVFDDIITKTEQEDLKNTLYGPKFNWFYINDVTKIDNEKQQRPCLTHLFMDNGNINSEWYNIVTKISDNVNKKLKKKLRPIQVRSFLQLSLNEKLIGKDKVDTAHIDLYIPHTVYLYYVNDCDGDTILYNYKSKNGKKDIPYFENIKIKKRITPKQGRVVVFDGMIWHTSSQPTKGTRTIINFDMVKEYGWR